MFRKKINFDLDEFRSRPLPSEQEIISRWTGDLDKPVVSVICNTYNQEMYIEDAIRGFLIQETDFPFEVIINDDASTDRNPEIIKSYAEKYPSIIKPVFQEENQYSQGRKPSVVSFSYTTGKYIALCEGDDFWINPRKLQRQLEALTKNSQCALVVSPGYTMTNKRISRKLHCYYGTSPLTFYAQDVLNVPGQFAPTASYFSKRSLFETLPSWFSHAPVGDLFIELWATEMGGITYLPEPASIYRLAAVGSWSQAMNSDRIRKIQEMSSKTLKCIEQFSQDSRFKQLSTTRKEAAWSFGLALEHLKECRYLEFKRSIELSYLEFERISLAQIIVFKFRNFPAILRYLIFKSNRS